jgi:hypothetical protein
MLDFPDPLGPIILVNPRNGPVYVYYSKLLVKINITERFEVSD